MSKLFKNIVVLAILAIILSVGAPAAQASSEPPFAAYGYQNLLGMHLSDRVVDNFIRNYNCFKVGQYQVCDSVGMALWIENEIVVSALLSAQNEDGREVYHGSLPAGLVASNSMADVENKLGAPDAINLEGYESLRASYLEEGIIIVYNSPSPLDKGASIHHIIVNADFSNEG